MCVLSACSDLAYWQDLVQVLHTTHTPWGFADRQIPPKGVLEVHSLLAVRSGKSGSYSPNFALVTGEMDLPCLIGVLGIFFRFMKFVARVTGPACQTVVVVFVGVLR